MGSASCLYRADCKNCRAGPALRLPSPAPCPNPADRRDPRRLAKLPEVVAIKDATGGLDIASAVASVGALPVLSGDDPLTLPMMAVGGAGVVSVASNIVPKRVVAMVRAAQAGDFAAARAEHFALLPLLNGLFAETNPVPAKYALQRMGLISSACVRAPLAELGEASKPVVEAACTAVGLF